MFKKINSFSWIVSICRQTKSYKEIITFFQMKKDLQGYHWCHGNHYELVNLPSWVAFTNVCDLDLPSVFLCTLDISGCLPDCDSLASRSVSITFLLAVIGSTLPTRLSLTVRFYTQRAVSKPSHSSSETPRMWLPLLSPGSRPLLFSRNLQQPLHLSLTLATFPQLAV